MPDKSFLVGLDLDSTLLDLPGFVQALPSATQAAFGIDPTEFTSKKIKLNYVDKNGGLIGYDPNAHFKQHGVDLTDTETLPRLVGELYRVRKELTGEDDFVYPDARRLLDRLRLSTTTEGKIFTVNTGPGWNLKRLLCGNRLEGIPVEVIEEPNKGPVINKRWRDGIVSGEQRFSHGIVVDDSPEQIEAVMDRPDIQRIQIVREGQRYSATKNPDIRRIGSLDELAIAM